MLVPHFLKIYFGLGSNDIITIKINIKMFLKSQGNKKKIIKKHNTKNGCQIKSL